MGQKLKTPLLLSAPLPFPLSARPEFLSFFLFFSVICTHCKATPKILGRVTFLPPSPFFRITPGGFVILSPFFEKDNMKHNTKSLFSEQAYKTRKVVARHSLSVIHVPITDNVMAHGYFVKYIYLQHIKQIYYPSNQ